MEILQIVKFISLFLAVVSFLFTALQIYFKLRLRRYKELMVEKIISMMEDSKSEGFILRTMVEEGYPPDIVEDKCVEVKNLMYHGR